MPPRPPSLEEAVFGPALRRRTSRVLGLGLATLVAANVVFVILWPESPRHLRFHFDLDEEGNWATWFNSTLDLLVALAAFALAWVSTQHPRTAAGGAARGWILTGLVFAYLAMDDAAQLHEPYVGPCRWLFTRMLDASGTRQLLWWQLRWYFWILVIGLPGLAILAGVLRFFRRTLWEAPAARGRALCGLGLLACNPIIEGLEGLFTAPLTLDGRPRFFAELYVADRVSWLGLRLLTLAQEVAEIGAVICLLGALLRYGERLVHERAPAAPAPAIAGIVPRVEHRIRRAS